MRRHFFVPLQLLILLFLLAIGPPAHAAVPDAPTGVTATAGNAQATVSFTAPLNNGGSPITGYTVTSNPVGGVDAQAFTNATSHTITGLANGTAYTFTVTANNLAGSSLAAVSSSVTPATTVPGAPTAVTATTGNAQATVTFTAPASNGGSPITGYTAACGTITGTGTASPITVTGLTNGIAYTCTVTATNFVGTSLASNSIPVTPAATAPGAPTIVSATLSNAQAMVTFTAPVSNGGSPITGYTATCGTFTGTGTASPITVTGLTNGIAYTCTVTATNTVGTSPASAPPFSVTLATVPGAPTGVTATPGNAQVTVTFTAPVSNGGSAITGYTATCGSTGITGTGTASPITVTGLTNGTAYTCTVTATNTVGTSLASTPPSLSVTLAGNQTITFGAQAGKVFGAAPFQLSPLATASSGLAVTYTSTTTSVCTISGTTVTIVAAGTCTIAANQAGGTLAGVTYNAAPQVTQNITVPPTNQIITFGAQAGKVFGAATFALSPLATVTSGLAVTYTSTTTSVCTISGTTVTIVAAGTCTIAADQVGNANYTAALQKTQNIIISQASQTITFGAQAGKAFGTPPFLLSPLATASSGLAVTYTSTTTSVCTISGITVAIVAAGTCTIAATQAGDSNYSAAPQVTQNIVISKGTQTITFGPQDAQVLGVAPFALNPVATASSGLAVSYSSTTATVCTISGTTFTALAVGTCTISASQAGNGNYTAAVAVTQSIALGKPTAPGTPTLTSIIAGFGSVTVSFNAPVFTGGSTITAYTATCIASGQPTRSSTGSGTTSMIIVQGLTINVTYSCSVTASNSVGTSTASAALPVTPVATYVIPTTSSPLTGLWWNENESGWGMSVTQHGTMVFVGWYTYDQSGAPTWYVMPSCPILGNACTGDIYTVSGGKSFVTPWDGSAKVVTKVGTGILTFVNANTGTFNFSINGVPGLKSITRQVFAAGSTLSVPDFSDLWWNPNESGWGVALSQQYGTIFAAMFGYDAIGNPIWYVASNCKVSGNSCSGDLYLVMGGTKPTTAWNGAGLVVTKVGFIEFVFADSTNGTMNFFINGLAGTKVITRQSF